MKPVDVKSRGYIDCSKKINDNNQKFKTVENVRTSKNKNVFANVNTGNWSEKVFVIKKTNLLYRGHMLLMILMEKKFLVLFTKTNCKKKIKKTSKLKKSNQEKR